MLLVKIQKMIFIIVVGGGPEGVLAASALTCFGGQIQGRLVLNDEEKLEQKNWY